MNYMSKCTESQTSSSCSSDDDFSKFSSPTVIKCGLPITSTIFPADTPADARAIVASLSLDNTNLCNSTNLVEFTANIVAGAGLTAATITFRIFKILQCNPTATPTAVTPIWTYTASAPGSTTAKFFTCDQGDCANYYVVATVTSNITGGSVTIVSPEINIVSAANENCCCNC